MGGRTSRLLRFKNATTVLHTSLRISCESKYRTSFTALTNIHWMCHRSRSIKTSASRTMVKDLRDIVAKSWSQKSVTDIYEQIRPNYSTESVEFLLDKIGALKQTSEEFVITEVGAGTGKYTRAMLRVLQQHSRKNVKIISTEPVEQMCVKFKEMIPDIEIIKCAADDISLASGTSDAVIAAQCFHFISDAESVSEIHRILKPGGFLAITWNLPDRKVPSIKTSEEMLQIEYIKSNVHRPEFSKEWLHQINKHGGFGPLNENDNFTYSTQHSLDGIMQRYKSVSVIAAAEDDEKERMLNTITEAWKSAEKNDQEMYEYRYVIWTKWFQKHYKG